MSCYSEDPQREDVQRGFLSSRPVRGFPLTQAQKGFGGALGNPDKSNSEAAAVKRQSFYSFR